MDILEYFLTNNKIVNYEEFTKDYKYNRFELKTNSVYEILEEINNTSYDEVAEKYDVSVGYLKETFRPVTKLPTNIRNYLKINDKIKKDIRTMLNSGYGKLHIANIEYENGNFINIEDIETVINEKEVRNESILQEPVVDIFNESIFPYYIEEI